MSTATLIPLVDSDLTLQRGINQSVAIKSHNPPTHISPNIHIHWLQSKWQKGRNFFEMWTTKGNDYIDGLFKTCHIRRMYCYVLVAWPSYFDLCPAISHSHSTVYSVKLPTFDLVKILDD